MPKETVVSNTAPTGTPGTTLWFDTSTNFLKYWDGGNWIAVPVGVAPNGVPPGGAANQLLAKSSAADYDDSWTSDLSVATVSATGNINSTGQSTFGQLDTRRYNNGNATGALQNVGAIRGMGWDGVSAYQVLANFTFGTDQPVSPSQAGGNIQFATTPNGAIGAQARLRIGNDGTVHIPKGAILGDASILTNPNAGTILDLNGGLFAERRQVITLVNGANNNLTLPTTSFVEFTGPTAAFLLTGIAGGVDGATINFVYLGTQSITIMHQNIQSTAANQIYTNTGNNEISYGPCSGLLVYNASLSRWQLIDWQPSAVPHGLVGEKSGSLMNATWGTTNQTTYATVGNVTWPQSFVKRYSGTLLEAYVSMSGWAGGPGMVYVGFSTSHPTAPTVSQTVAQFFFNTTGTHHTWSGFNQWSGLGAGTFGCSFWVKVGAAGVNVQSDANDVFCWRIKEVWP